MTHDHPEETIRIRFLRPDVAFVDVDDLLAAVVSRGEVERELEREAAVFAPRAAHRDRISEALCDLRAAG